MNRAKFMALLYTQAMTPAEVMRTTGVDPIYAAVSERDFQRDVITAARLHGWAVFWTHRSEHSPAGEFDLRLIRPPRFLVVELKSEAGKLTLEQGETLRLLRGCPGVESYVWRPSDVDAMLAVLADFPLREET